MAFQAIWHLERVILQVDTCRPHGGKSNQYYQLKDHHSELKKKKRKRNNCILSVAISNIPIRLSIPPLDRQIAVITQKPCGGPLQAKTLTTLLPASSAVSVIWKVVFIWLPCYQSGHWLFPSAWARLSSETLNTSHSQPHTRPHISITTLFLQSLSFAPVLFFSSLPFRIPALILLSDGFENLQTREQPSKNTWAAGPSGEARCHSPLPRPMLYPQRIVWKA